MVEAHNFADRAAFAEKLDWLFRNVTRPDGTVHSLREVGAYLKRSATTVSNLRTGKAQPRWSDVEQLAAIFGVPVAYFYSDEEGERIQAEVELGAAIRRNDVRLLAMRASQLGTNELRIVAEMIDALAKATSDTEADDTSRK